MSTENETPVQQLGTWFIEGEMGAKSAKNIELPQTTGMFEPPTNQEIYVEEFEGDDSKKPVIDKVRNKPVLYLGKLTEFVLLVICVYTAGKQLRMNLDVFGSACVTFIFYRLISTIKAK